MTREDFMEYARREVDNAFRGQKNRMMNLVEQAWSEGKRNAETDHMDEIAADILEQVKRKLGSNCSEE